MERVEQGALALPETASLGLTDYSPVDRIVMWCKPVTFGVDKRLGSPTW